jgi:hypothetical protein
MTFSDDELERLAARFEAGMPWRSWVVQRDDNGQHMIVVQDKARKAPSFCIIKTAGGHYAARGPRVADVTIADEIDELLDFMADHIKRPS